ncbi:MAG: LysE family translocator [Pseudomonadales bacterium]|nr:LysE family translocator [Pseudomonadales bacterium]
MPPLETLIAFTLAAFIMNLSPGPSNFYIIARTLENGISGGLSAVAGLAVGSLVHVVAAVLGLSALFNYSPLAYSALKLIGAAYLIYLGINALRRGSRQVANTEAVEQKQLLRNQKIFQQSVIVEVSNPKTALFFIALLPQFIDPSAGPAAPQFLLLGLIVTASAIPCDLFVTFFANKAANWIKGSGSVQRWQDRVSGAILTGLGAYVLFEEVRADSP